jgi:4-amino-4-deoxy-L-arabinose transferase-like glycosyltransferase
MQAIRWADRLWGKDAKLRYLLFAAALLLFAMLGARELWTQEHRWSDIVSAMVYSNDYLHPVLDGNEYYDKPLLSYWFILLLRWVTGHFNLWVLRVPSAMAGFLAIWAIYRLGVKLKSKELGLLSGWLLLTTFYFVFWSRVGNADMMNLCGALWAVTWYIEKRDAPTFFDYVVFFLILAVTALCKGLVGPIVALIVIFSACCIERCYRQFFDIRIIVAIMPAMILYFLPFFASYYFNQHDYQQNGLYQVYRENILRYVKPFDHQDPIYVYFIFLPLYLFPWVVFFMPAIMSVKSRWKHMEVYSKWMVLSVLLLFLFFTFSGSRRNYYILPVVPFAILVTADWILSEFKQFNRQVAQLVMAFFALLLVVFAVLQPLFYARGGLATFATVLKKETGPLTEWRVVMLDPDAKIRFYLTLPPDLKHYDTVGKPEQQTKQSLMQTWTVLKEPHPNTIYLTRKIYVPYLGELLPDYQIVSAEPTFLEKTFRMIDPNSPVAFVPKTIKHEA